MVKKAQAGLLKPKLIATKQHKTELRHHNTLGKCFVEEEREERRFQERRGKARTSTAKRMCAQQGWQAGEQKALKGDAQCS